MGQNEQFALILLCTGYASCCCVCMFWGRAGGRSACSCRLLFVLISISTLWSIIHKILQASKRVCARAQNPIPNIGVYPWHNERRRESETRIFRCTRRSTQHCMAWHGCGTETRSVYTLNHWIILYTLFVWNNSNLFSIITTFFSLVCLRRKKYHFELEIWNVIENMKRKAVPFFGVWVSTKEYNDEEWRKRRR